ncbi:histidine kinase [Daejeonella sp.]|uniref:sensor histidine kinase n=1 Tax=Daejeonella sp. TaxID=2805397 RepID=UPI00272F7073|nr:histidine kinase [Daejeonella sp.]MDP2414978.1 histidine kinase [Daejeonella sp.]
MRFVAFLLLIFFISLTCHAQQSKYTAFTVSDGLPSNNVYKCIEDNSGFLWVATDAGIARFDGKRFQVFTTLQGLPDNDVLEVMKENSGRIWVNCFKQGPAYFDEVQNRFINARENSSLAKVSEGTSNMYSYPLKEGGVLYVNERGSFIFRNNKLIEYPTLKIGNFLFKENKDGTLLRWTGNKLDPVLNLFQTKIYQTKGTAFIDSLVITTTSRNDLSARNIKPSVDDGKLYIFYPSLSKCLIYSDFKVNPLRFKMDSLKIPERFFVSGFTQTYVYLLGNSGKIYVFDKKTLQQLLVISGNYLPNSMFNDSKGNVWASTVDKGLILYKNSQFTTMEMPPDLQGTVLLSIARKRDGSLLAGNSYGEVVETDGRTSKIHRIPSQSKDFRQKKILISQNKVFTFSEGGIYVNYTRKLVNPINQSSYPAKTAMSYNDSIIIFGLTSGLNQLNSRTEKVSRLGSIYKRIVAFTRTTDGIIYYGSTDGLYKHDYDRNVSSSLTQSNSLLSHRITALCATRDKLVWVATSSNGLVIVKNDKVLLNITAKDGIISNSLLSISAAGPGKIWLGTNQGISVITYKLQGRNISYSIQNLSVNDGLSHNSINEMLYQKDTIYAATGKGISVIPANISIPKFNIPVKLIRITINQRDTILSARYKLGYQQQNIQMQFAGIELSGHFKNLQYTLDKNENWTNLDENTLTVQLNNGAHVIQVRALDVNGNISPRTLTIQFDIATPFWKAIWFWLIIASVMQLIIFYLVNRRQKRRKEAKLVKEIAGVQTASLEQQAFTSLMNPHFMFNALNSIQHYINVQDRQNANRYLSDFASLIRKNFEAAQQSFIPLEQEIENIKIYLRLEQMRFNDRFSYQIMIDENLEPEDWMIPTMILQPLLENALLHGLMPSAIDGELLIDLKQQDGNLLIIIIDNGIGLANSLALKEDSGHRSRGMELIKKRIAALSHFGSQAITISMSPAFASEKNPGNKICLFIPAGLHLAWLKAQQK